MASVDNVRTFALSLPRAYEALVRDRVKFRVGRIVFASLSRDETVLGFGYPRELRDKLIRTEPDKFHYPSPSNMRYQWVQTWLHSVEPDELEELLYGAWEMCVPKSVSALHRAESPEP